LTSVAHISRQPVAPLDAFVSRIWAAEGGAPAPQGRAKELLLPVGHLHLVIRLEEQPLRLYRDLQDPEGRDVSTAVLGGLRTGPYIRDVSRPVPCLGAQLRPGAGGLLTGAPAGVFTGRHVPLEDLWGRAEVERLRMRLAEAPSLEARLDLFEALLIRRLPPLRHMDPRIAEALAGLACQRPVAAVTRDVGASHRHFTALFREAVGLNPKTWLRLQRFGRVLDRLGRAPQSAWADLAAAEGYADQPHLAREFRAFAGLTPGDYRRRAPLASRHVPL
jgi:AraC-like DNA-binding protein